MGWDTLLDESNANIEKTTRTKVQTLTAACVREYVVHLERRRNSALMRMDLWIFHMGSRSKLRGFRQWTCLQVKRICR